MRVLVTNDDGVGAPGIGALARALAEAGHDVLVAAPAADWSGTGAALGPVHVTGRILYERTGIDGLPDDAAVVAVDGPPALTVVAACLGAFGPPPDLVASGVNDGANVGQSVLHSGTVGAALTALSFGVPALAVSLGLGPDRPFAAAADIACRLVAHATKTGLPAVLNVNVPARPWAGVRAATLARTGLVQARVAHAADGVLQFEMPPGGPLRATDDVVLLDAGWVTVTRLTGLAADTAGLEDIRVAGDASVLQAG